jgi:hypothetical protein
VAFQKTFSFLKPVQRGFDFLALTPTGGQIFGVSVALYGRGCGTFRTLIWSAVFIACAMS